MADSKQRERLIKLLNEVGSNVLQFPTSSFIESLSDHLLANGVIVPPVKVGAIIYALTYDRKDYMPLKVTSLESLARWMDEDQFGRELFPTREEAEKALRGE